jgi:hypothetical protein
MFRYKLRTLLILMTVGPPLIGFWPSIKKSTVERAAQITASDVAVLAATSSLVAIRARLYWLQNATRQQRTDAAIG